MLHRPQSNPLICFSLAPLLNSHPLYLLNAKCQHTFIKCFVKSILNNQRRMLRLLLLLILRPQLLTLLATQAWVCVLLQYEMSPPFITQCKCCILTADVCMNYLHLQSVFSLTTVMTEQQSEENLNKLVEVKHLSTSLCVCGFMVSEHHKPLN